ncbi:hypothetical protein [Geopseudomonas aromaticivorans]
MKAILSKAANAVGNAALEAKGTALDKAAGVAQAGRDAAFTVESSVLGVRDAVLDKAAGATGAAIKFYHGAAGAVLVMVNFGIVVAAIVAPVPTAIGAGLLWLLQWQLGKMCDQVDESVDEERDRRKLERVTGLLKKYGQIPETATLQTDLVEMVINSGTGEVSGKVLAGEFQGCDISALSNDALARLVEFARDDDTKSVLEAYQSLRNIQAKSR